MKKYENDGEFIIYTYEKDMMQDVYHFDERYVEKNHLAVQNKIFNQSIKSIDDEIKDNSNFGLKDFLFYQNSKNPHILSLVFSKNKPQILNDILTITPEIESIKASDWNFIFSIKSNACHKVLKKFYGQKYYEDIFSPDKSNISSYTFEHFKTFYKKGLSNQFFKNLDNIYSITQSVFGQFLFAEFIHVHDEKAIALIKDDFKKHHFEPLFLWDNKFLLLRFISPSETDLLLEVHGKNRASYLIGKVFEANALMVESLKIAKRNDFKFNNHDDFIHLLELGLDLKDNAKHLLPYLQSSPDLMLMCILTHKIPKQFLLEMINSPDYKQQAAHAIIKDNVNHVELASTHNSGKLKI